MKGKVTVNSGKLDSTFQRAMKETPRVTARVVTDIILDLAAESAKRAPIESGDLRSNAHGEVNGLTVYQNQQPTGALPEPAIHAAGRVSYSLPYALRQHEDLTYRHDRTDGYRRPDGTTVNMIAGGQAKYLEGPFLERKGRYIGALQEAIKGVLK